MKRKIPGKAAHEVDNFEEIKEILFGKESEKLTSNQFYFLQILVRGKDGNKVSGNNKNRLVKYYTITSASQLDSLKEEIKGICKIANGRAYIHPTRRDYMEVANLTLELTTRTYISKNWIGFRGTYSTACGKSYVKKNKMYVIDMDDMSPSDEKYKAVKELIESLRGKEVGCSKIVGEIETKNGYHIITHPFDVQKFHEKFPDIDVHKNNPTLLYFYWEDYNID